MAIKYLQKKFAKHWGSYVNKINKEKLIKDHRRLGYFIAIITLFLSRLLFLSHSPDFFDANEYIWRATLPKFIEVMTTGHPPFHPLYIFFSSIFYKTHLAESALLAATLPSAIFGSLSIIVLFLLIRKLFDGRIAWLVSFFYSIIPFVWISQITILVDPTEHFFYFLSLYLIVLSLRSKTGYLWSVLAGLSFGLSFFTHTQVAFWLPGFLAILIMHPKSLISKQYLKTIYKIILFALFSGLFIIFYIHLLLVASQARGDLSFISIWAALKYLFFGNIGDRSNISIFSWANLMLIISTSLVALISFFGFLKMLIDKKFKEVAALVIFLVPSSILASSFIYENLHGRAVIIGVVPILIFTSYFLTTLKFPWRILLGAIITFELLFISLPAVSNYHRLPSANEALRKIEESSLSGGVFVATNSTRTFANYRGEFISFGDTAMDADLVEEKVKNALLKNLPVYISHDAIVHPFRHYDGQFYDLRTTSTGIEKYYPTLLGELFSDYNLNLDRIVPDGFDNASYQLNETQPNNYLDRIEQNLDRSQIVFGQLRSDKKPVSVATIELFGDSFCKTPKDDITARDFGICLIRAIGTDKRPETWTFTDKDGWFYLQKRVKIKKLVVNVSSSQMQAPDLDGIYKIDGKKIGDYKSSQDLETAIANIDGSYYVIASKNGNLLNFELYSFDFILPN